MFFFFFVVVYMFFFFFFFFQAEVGIRDGTVTGVQTCALPISVKILEGKDGWFKVQGMYDGYEGWITQHLLAEISKEVAQQPVSFVSTGLISKLNTPEDRKSVV